MNTTSEKKTFIQYVASIFWNFNEHRLHAFWQVLGTLLSTVILTIIFGAPIFAVIGAGPAPYIEQSVLYVAAVVSVFLATRFLDRRRFSDTGIYEAELVDRSRLWPASGRPADDTHLLGRACS